MIIHVIEHVYYNYIIKFIGFKSIYYDINMSVVLLKKTRLLLFSFKKKIKIRDNVIKMKINVKYVLKI